MANILMLVNTTPSRIDWNADITLSPCKNMGLSTGIKVAGFTGFSFIKLALLKSIILDTPFISPFRTQPVEIVYLYDFVEQNRYYYLLGVNLMVTPEIVKEFPLSKVALLKVEICMSSASTPIISFRPPLYLSLIHIFSKVIVQSAACEQGYVGGSAVFFQIPQVPLSPQTNRLFFFGW